MLRPQLLGLGLVNVLHQDTLVLEHVTLRLKVELVVEVLINLTSFTVLPQQATKHTQATHPLHLRRETGLSGTLALTVAGVTTKTLSLVHVANTLTRLRHLRLPDNLAILDQLADVGARVGVCNVSLLSRVKPDLALANTEDGRSQTPLNRKVNHD